MADALYEIMRWLHLASMATLVGGMLFARLVMARSLEGVAPDAREPLVERAASLYRPFVYTAIGGLVVSGAYNLLTNPGHRPLYHMLLGIKLLLALHVFAVSILIVQPKNPRRVRMMTGVVISGLTIIAISAWLRHIF
jgi:putative copper export protein